VVGAGFVVPPWREGLAERVHDEATAMALRMAREEGLFGGTSTGGNVVAVLRLAERLKPGATVVTLLCDSGMKYFSAYRDALERTVPSPVEPPGS
jgi:cysteine synthase